MKKSSIAIISFLLALIGVLIIWFLFDAKVQVYESEFEKFELRQSERDSIIVSQREAIKDLKFQRDTIFINYTLYTVELDSALVQLERLSKPNVTSSTKKEALKWVKEHNASLSQ